MLVILQHCRVYNIALIRNLEHGCKTSRLSTVSLSSVKFTTEFDDL